MQMGQTAVCHLFNHHPESGDEPSERVHDHEQNQTAKISRPGRGLLKATGRGLALPLERVVVPASADEGSFEVVVGAESAEWPGASRWSVRPLSPAPGYEGALAHEPGPRRVELFHYPDV